MTQTHDQFTFLYEDGDTKLIYEFKEVGADDVVTHVVDFLKGCGYMESTIHECMKEASEAYFDALSTHQYVMNWNKPDPE